MKKRLVTLPELVKEVGSAELAKLVQCDPSLPRKWGRGQKPSWKNLDTLIEIADKRGLVLSILGVKQ